MLVKFDFDDLFINKVYNLVLKHELGGDKETDILMDADSISFFEGNLPTYLKDNGGQTRKRRWKLCIAVCQTKQKIL